MAKPLHILAFEHFKQRYDGDDKVKMFVAFGIFVESEYKWASSQRIWPTDGKYKNYHDCSIPHSIDLVDQSADSVVYEFVNDVIEEERANFVRSALDAYKIEAAKSHHRWWQGVLEGTGGALLWSIILIAAVIIAGRLNIDVLGAFERAATTHQESH